MKKLLIISLFLAMTSWAVLPAAADRHEGYRMGPGMMEREYGVRQRSSLDEDKLKAYDEEMEEHYKNTTSQRQEILVKQHEMATLLINPKTTKDVVLDKQKELQNLMNSFQRQELSFRWDIYKKYPELTPDMYGGCLGLVTGYRGARMMGYGSCRGMMNPDNYDENGPGMMPGWRNWRKWLHWRDKDK